MIVIAAITVAGMIACSQDDPTNKGKGGKKNEAKSVDITIDGDFADWLQDGVTTVSLGEEYAYAGLKTMKVAANKKMLFVYFEYALQREEPTGEEEQGPIQTVAPMVIMVNADGDPTTGCANWLWSKEGCGADLIIASDGGFLNGDAIKDIDDLGVRPYIGENGKDEWKWEDPTEVAQFWANKGEVKAGVATMEMSIERSAANISKGGPIGIGLIIQNGGWATTGVLPVAGQAGVEDLLDVLLP